MDPKPDTPRPKPHEIATFRFEVIAPFLDKSLSRRTKHCLMRKRSAVTWPDGRKGRVPRSSIHRWIEAFAKRGYQGLLPKQRSDAGKPRENYSRYVERAISLLLEQPERSLTQIQTYLKLEFAEFVLPVATLHRHLVEHAAYPAVEKLRAGKERKLYGRYEAAHVHECWQIDGKGPFTVRLKSGQRLRAHVLSVLDDHSRSILAALIATGETTKATIAVFQKAALRYGLPERMQFDRGSAFDSLEFRSGIARCGVHRNFVRAKTPTTQGKIESYHRSLGRWFLDELKAQEVVDYDHLQQLLDATIALLYQKHRHREIRCTPEERLAGQVSARRISEHDLARAFFVEITKSSDAKTGEVQLDNDRFCVPLAHAGKRSIFRYDPLRPHAVLVTKDGREIVLEPFVKKPLPAPLLEEKRGYGQLQRLVDKWRGTERPNAEPAFGMPEILSSLTDLVGRMVPTDAREAVVVANFYRAHGPVAKEPWLLACKRTDTALGKGRPIDVYLEDLERQIRKSDDQAVLE